MLQSLEEGMLILNSCSFDVFVGLDEGENIMNRYYINVIDVGANW